MHPEKAQRATSELFFSVALVALPTLAGVVVNSLLGWWAGLAAFLLIAALVGRAAYVAGREDQNR
jgi:hypothetical protein